MVKRNEQNSREEDLMVAKRQTIKEGNSIENGKSRHKSRSKTN